MSTFTPNDEQVIERVRKAQRYRRPIGALCLIGSVICMGLVMYFVHDTRAQSVALFDELAKSQQPPTRQLAQELDEVRFNTGFYFGFTAAASLAGAAESAVIGMVWLLVRNRKDRLLLQCWDEQKAIRSQASEVGRLGSRFR